MKILLLFACMLVKMGLTSPWSSYSSSTFPFFPVVVGSACLLIIQLVSVVIHTPSIEQLSVMASANEVNLEASHQLFLMAFTW